MADIECLFCNREFKTFSGMLIHLEAGICEGDDYVETQFRHYVNRGDTSHVDYARNDTFTCKSCDKAFVQASGLFQHIESRACGADGEVIDDFDDFLRN
jgi:hypothetical protein